MAKNAIFEHKNGQKYHFRVGFMKQTPWGADFDVVLFECEWPPPPIYLHDYLEHVFKIWHGFSTNVKKIFFCVRNFCRPPETPLWPEISVTEKNF